MVGKPFRPKSAPVIESNLIQCVHHIIKRVCLYLGRPALPAVEEMAEIVYRLLAVGLLADDRVHPQEVQNIFVVVIPRPAPGFPLGWGTLHGGHSISRILQVAPGAARNVVEPGRQ